MATAWYDLSCCYFWKADAGGSGALPRAVAGQPFMYFIRQMQRVVQLVVDFTTADVRENLYSRPVMPTKVGISRAKS